MQFGRPRRGLSPASPAPIVLAIALLASGGAALALPYDNSVSIIIDGGKRVVESNGIPVHETGKFPNPGNPNRIRPQDITVEMPMEPEQSGLAAPIDGYMFGIALNGVVFDPGTVAFWNRDPQAGWTYAALTGKVDLGMDASNGHVQPDGTYHYHGIPNGFLADQAATDGHSPLVGYAADGFPIYAQFGYADPESPASGIVELVSSYRLKPGARPSGPGGPHDGSFVEDWTYVEGAGDLDACNGRRTVTPDYPEGTYAYFLTAQFPFVPRCFIGTPDDSFAKRRAAVGGGRETARSWPRRVRPAAPGAAVAPTEDQGYSDGCRWT